MPRYTSLKDLVGAYENHTLDRARHKVVVGYDALWLDSDDPNDPEPIFYGGSAEDLLREALDLLGIAWQEA